MNDTKKERPVSPINGQPLPEGKRFERGEEQRERARKAGQKSGEVRRARKTLREELLALLSQDITDKRGRTVPTQVALSTALIQEALKGNTKAFEVVRDTIGEKPVDKIEQVNLDVQYRESVEYVKRIMFEE